MAINRDAWLLFVLLCIIWGSSFLLMKLGLYDQDGLPLLSPWQVAGIRILSSGMVLLPFAIKSYAKIPARLRLTVLMSGVYGSFLPAFLFCLAETEISSSLAGTLNAMTPIFTLLIAWLIYRAKVPLIHLLGIALGFLGCVLLFFQGRSALAGNVWYGSLVLVATGCYGWNVNLVKHKLHGINALTIASVAFAGLILPSLFVLVISGLFELSIDRRAMWIAIGASAFLGVVGTAFASILFYRLVARSGVLFASLVTYGIPFVAIGWGLVYGESITLGQVAGLLIILAGVYLANVKRLNKSAG